MGLKYALIIANTEYIDPSLNQLAAPGKDAENFARILRDPDLCAFDHVNVLLDQPEAALRDEIDAFFDQKKPSDLLLLYFSGHGIRDELGSLYLAVRNTNHRRLRTTAIKSEFIRESMDHSRSRRQILILDCCNSGAFAHGTKAVTGGSVGTASAFEGTGYGRIVLTASDSTQLAWEGDQIIGETENSLFTHFLIKGLEGEADHNGDGEITVDELYDYAYEKIVNITPNQTPGKWSYKQQGEIPLRQLSEAQKEKLRHLELERRQKQEQEERDRLDRLESERQAIIENLSRELQTAKAIADAAAREASETISQERAKREAAEREVTLRRQTHESMDTATYRQTDNIAVPVSPVKKFRGQAVLWGSSVMVVAILGLLFALNNNLGQMMGVEWFNAATPVFTPQALTFEPPAIPQSQANTPVSLPSAKISTENAANVVQLARWGKGVINDVKFSTDGKTIALASSIGIYVLDASSLQEKLFIETQHSIQSLTFTPDMKTIVAISNYGEIIKFRAEDGTFLQGTKVDYQYFLNIVGISPVANLAATAGGSQTRIYIADVVTGNITRFLEPNNLTVPYLDTPRDLTWSSDGERLASCTNQGIYLWNPKTGELIWKIQIIQDDSGGYRVPKLIFSPDATKIAFRHIKANSDSVTISVFNTQAGSLITSFEEYDVIGDMTFSPDGQDLYYGTREGSAIVRHIADGKVLNTLDAHTDTMTQVVFAPDGSSFVSTSEDGAIKLWKDTFALISSRNDFADSNSDLDISISSDNQSVLSNQGRNANIWNIASGKISQTVPTIDQWTPFARFLSTRLSIVMNGDSNLLDLWDYQDNKLTKISETDAQAWNSDTVAVSPDDQFLAIDTDISSIYLFKFDESGDYTNTYPITLRGHNDYITALAFSPDSTLLASGSADETVRVWTIATGDYQQFTDHSDWINGVALSPAGTLLASSAEDGTLIIQRVDDGTIRYKEQFAGKASPYKLAFAPDGQILAFSDYDGNIQLLSVAEGKIIQSLSGHTLVPQRLIFTSDGKLLISSSGDGTVRIWGIKP